MPAETITGTNPENFNGKECVMRLHLKRVVVKHSLLFEMVELAATDIAFMDFVAFEKEGQALAFAVYTNEPSCHPAIQALVSAGDHFGLPVFIVHAGDESVKAHPLNKMAAQLLTRTLDEIGRFIEKLICSR